MEVLFNSLGTQLIKRGRHITFLVDWNVVKPIVKKWSRNRDPDMERVTDLLTHVSNGGYFPPMLHVADLEGEGLVCYDGNHRREALNAIANPPKVIIDLLTTASQKDVYDAFEALNKSVQVPAIYFDEPSINTSNVREEILALVKKYESKFKSHVSPSARCHAPQFNRDMFVDNLYKIWTTLDGCLNVHELENGLDTLNNMYSQERICRPHSAYKPKVVQKCLETGLWLFIDREIPVDHLRTVMRL